MRPAEKVDSERDPRTQSVWDLHDFGSGRGIEIGPLFRPLVHRHEADVRYLDVYDQAGLGEQYADDPSVPRDDIVEVDYALVEGDRVRSMPEAAGRDAPYAWFLASHVIEHVPDLIGWLGEIAELVEDDGSLVLVVPDMRYSFDLFRPATTVGMMLQAHEDGDVRPSTRAVYDHFREAIVVDSEALWQQWVRPDYADRMFDRDIALTRAGEADSTYIDAHVWLFTPDLFVEQLHDLRRLGHSSWYVERVEPTSLNQLEFLARLRRLPRDADAASVEPDGEVRPTTVRPGWDVPSLPSDEVLALRAQVVRLREKVQRRNDKIAAQRRRIGQLRARLDATTTSRRWRIAGAVAAPAHAVRRLRRR